MYFVLDIYYYTNLIFVPNAIENDKSIINFCYFPKPSTHNQKCTYVNIMSEQDHIAKVLDHSIGIKIK